jgi:ubiquinol-cytochrome c reductase cytochrome c subunit
MRRTVESILAVALAAAALLSLGDRGAPAAGPLVDEGRSLFVDGCSTCHGLDARGVPGRGPSLRGVGELSADFYLRTGRMPLAAPDDQPERRDSPYTRHQIDALVAYVGSFGGPAIPRVDPRTGDIATGFQLFSERCAGCHQIVARGGIVTRGTVPSLQDANSTDVAEALHIGPYVMPRFRDLDSARVASLARYVESTHHPLDRGGWGLGNIGPIPEGMVAWLLAGFALVLTIRLIGERTPG